MSDPFVPPPPVDRARLVRGWRRLAPLVRPHARLAGLGLVAVLATTGIAVALPALQGALVRDLEQARGANLKVLALAIFAAHALRFAFEVTQSYLLQSFGAHVLHDLRVSVFRHLQRVAIGVFERTPVGVLVTRVTSDVEAIGELLSAALVTLLRDVLLLVASLVAMIVVAPGLALVAMVTLPLVVAAMTRFRRRARAAYAAVRQGVGRVNAGFAESVSGMSTIQVSGREAHERERMGEASRALRDANLKSSHHWGVFGPLVAWLSTVALALVLHRGAGMVGAGEIDVGTLAAFLWWTRLYFQPLRDLAEKYNVFESAMAAVDRLESVLDLPEDPALAARGTVERVQGAIRFEGVGFAYREGEPVLEDVSFDVAPGSRLALVGATGSGKSTIVKLLLGFHRPTRGRILVDGVDLAGVDPRALRRRAGIVPQEVVLFRGTVRENLSLWDARLSDAQLLGAAERVQATAVIERHPQRLERRLEEGGADLSAGERQLFAFARALAADPDLLVLDEATAQVDTETERLLERAVGELVRGRTSIIIAHRLSTIETADQILVVSGGRIIERGTHAELIAARGAYARLHDELETSSL